MAREAWPSQSAPEEVSACIRKDLDVGYVIFTDFAAEAIPFATTIRVLGPFSIVEGRVNFADELRPGVTDIDVMPKVRGIEHVLGRGVRDPHEWVVGRGLVVVPVGRPLGESVELAPDTV